MSQVLPAPGPKPPSDHKGWKIVDAVMRRHGRRPDSLIEALHAVQGAFGYLDKPAIAYVARALGVPLSRAYGVASFYHYFSFKPAGRHTCIVCMGTACYIRGGPEILRAVQQAYGVRPGQTTADGELSLLTARCFGACGLAPTVAIDGAILGKTTPQQVVEHLKEPSDHAA
jgi:bidirectional [NiFe] hydrogenase diaphorase subunit